MRGFPKLLVLIVFWTVGINAQNRQLLYDFQEVPQSLMLNPGMKVSQNWHAGIPVFSGLYFQAYTSGVTVNDLFANDGVDFTTKVRERAIQAMGRKDDFGSTSQIEGFNVGFRGRNRPDDYYSFGMYGEFDIISYWPKDLAELAYEGNGGDNIGRAFDLGDLKLRGDMVNVFHFGINRKVDRELTIGARVKLYSSIFQFQSLGNSGSFRTVQGLDNIYRTILEADMVLQTSGIQEFYETADDETSGSRREDLVDLFTKRVLLGGNLGLGLDAGFTYQLNPQTSITGSILDLGFIYNSGDVWNYSFRGRTSTEGISVFLPEDIDQVDNDLWRKLIDEIEEAMPYGENSSSYLSFRPLKAYGSIRYDYGEPKGGLFDCDCDIRPGRRPMREYYRNSLGGQLFLMKRPRGIQAALTAFYQKRLGRVLSLRGSYTIDKYSWTNLGLGLNLQAGPINLYVLGDNLLGYSNIADSHYASLHFGINILSWNGN